MISYLLPVERLSIEPPSNGEAKELSGKPLWDGNGDGGLECDKIIHKQRSKKMAISEPTFYIMNLIYNDFGLCEWYWSLIRNCLLLSVVYFMLLSASRTVNVKW